VAAIQKAYGLKVQATMTQGSGGVFDVTIDGEKVFSKWEMFRFPTNKEILAEIAKRLPKE